MKKTEIQKLRAAIHRARRLAAWANDANKQAYLAANGLQEAVSAYVLGMDGTTPACVFLTAEETAIMAGCKTTLSESWALRMRTRQLAEIFGQEE